jgi:hypothetical protein
MSANETMKLIADRIELPNGSIASSSFPKAASAALTTSDASSRKPRAATSPRLMSLVLTKRENVVPVGFAFHMTFNADCISPNAPDAVRMSVTSPTTVATVPDDLLEAFAIAVAATAPPPLP